MNGSAAELLAADQEASMVGFVVSHILCVAKEGRLVMRKCKDLLKRCVYIIVFCVFCYIWFHIFYFSVFIHLF